MTKICTQCKHSVILATNEFVPNTYGLMCNRKVKPSPVNGYEIGYLSCVTERSTNRFDSYIFNLCGEAGRFWEAKDVG